MANSSSGSVFKAMNSHLTDPRLIPTVTQSVMPGTESGHNVCSTFASEKVSICVLASERGNKRF